MTNGFHNWSDVRVFLAVLRSGSTLAASRHLGMAQPTVARRIEALEQALKLTLFDRDTRGFRPTAQARHLLAAAEAMEAAAADLAKTASTGQRAAGNPIRITAPRVNILSSFSPLLAEFTAEHPASRFELLSTYDELDLCAGAADLAIRFAFSIDDDRLICRKLTEATISLYASTGYVARNGKPTSMTDLDGHDVVVIENGPSSLRLNAWLIDHLQPGQITSRCDDLESLVTAVRAGLGIGAVPTGMAIDHADLLRCFPPPEGTSVPVWMLISPAAWRRPEVKAFAAFLVPRFRAIFAERL
jgi:DNA-binding transcriptional LysR family regulator